jgi:hypothetical protein
MRQLFLPILLFCTLCTYGQKAVKKKSQMDEVTMSRLKLIQLKIDSSLTHKIDSIHSLTSVFLLDKENSDDNLFNVVTAVIALLSLLTSVGGIIYTYRSFQKEKSNKQIDFLSEIDKMLINNPYLWTLYDTRKSNFTITGCNNLEVGQQELDGQLEALCYFHLNNFELVFSYPSANMETRRTWSDYMVHLIVSSTRFREVMKKEADGYVYTAPYRRKMKELLGLAEKIMPFYEQYATDPNSRQVYYDAAKKILNENHK